MLLQQELLPMPVCSHRSSDDDVSDWLAMLGVQLNAVDGAGNTALMDAIRHSHKEAALTVWLMCGGRNAKPLM